MDMDVAGLIGKVSGLMERVAALEQKLLDAETKASKKNEVFETMTQFNIGNWSIRVWRECEEFKVPREGDIEVLDVLGSIPYKQQQKSTPKALFEKIKSMRRVSAMEALDRQSRCGGLYYPDWR